MKRSRTPAKRTNKPKLGETSVGKEAAIEVAKKVAIWGTGITLTYLFVIRPIFQKVGLIKTQDEKNQEKQEQDYSSSATSPFNPNYYKSVSGAQLVTKANAQAIAQTLYDAHGLFNDDEQAVYGALRQLSYKTQLSWVADVFYQQYQQDLYQYLRNFLDDSEMSIVNSIAANLK
jgi:hypothetical protein